MTTAMIRKLFANLIVFTCAAIPVASQTLQAVFPGRLAVLSSPDGALEVLNVDQSSDGPGPPHALYLIRKRTREKMLLQHYSRHVTVGWAPGSDRLFVNDAEGSDSTNCVVYRVAAPATRLDAGQVLRSNRSSRGFFRNDHVYVEGVRFEGRDSILVAVHGYGPSSPAGFRGCYVVSLASTRVRRTACSKAR
jgi:hypothetical protein